MTFKDINEEYTKIVLGFLKRGFRINTATMSGNQGELARTDLTDGKEIHRVILKTGLAENKRIETIIIVCGLSHGSNVPDTRNFGEIIYNSDLEVEKKICFQNNGFNSYEEIRRYVK